MKKNCQHEIKDYIQQWLKHPEKDQWRLAQWMQCRKCKTPIPNQKTE